MNNDSLSDEMIGPHEESVLKEKPSSGRGDGTTRVALASVSALFSSENVD